MKYTPVAVLLAASLSLAACQPKQAEKKPAEPAAASTTQTTASTQSDSQKQGYALGATMGHYMSQQLDMQAKAGVDLNHEDIIKGFTASLRGKSDMTEDQIKEQINALRTLVTQKQAEKAKVEGEKNLKAGEEFLAKNAKRDGVKVTDSGLQYEVLSEGKGPKPKATDTVKVNYKGTLLDGTEFDSSYKRNKPAVFPLNRVIPGWTEAVQLMNVGSKYRFYIPAKLAYGSRSTGKITPNSTLIFDIELLDIETPKDNGDDKADSKKD